jgi:hypothetical protein
LFQARTKQVIGSQLNAGACGRTDAEPFKSKRVTAGNPVLRVEWQKNGHRFLLSTIEYIALKFRYDQS